MWCTLWEEHFYSYLCVSLGNQITPSNAHTSCERLSEGIQGNFTIYQLVWLYLVLRAVVVAYAFQSPDIS